MGAGFYASNYTLPATVYSFDVDDDGTWSNRKVFAFIDNGLPDGVHADTNGNSACALESRLAPPNRADDPGCARPLLQSTSASATASRSGAPAARSSVRSGTARPPVRLSSPSPAGAYRPRRDADMCSPRARAARSSANFAFAGNRIFVMAEDRIYLATVAAEGASYEYDYSCEVDEDDD